MQSSDAYRTDLVLAWVFRVGLYCGTLAILTLVLISCSPRGSTDILPSMSADSRPVRPVEKRLDSESTTQPLGCDEKSDSSLKRPLL